MKNYINELLLKLGHPNSKRPQKSPHEWREIGYGSKIQLAPDEDDSELLDEEGIRWVQMVAQLDWRSCVDTQKHNFP